ncbi:MAG TPA: FliH/SctL family protein [Planctomycetaceae bacterium]|nr:FliH/SctL family protein [Planctomycetaceae bacterium]
MSLDSPRLLKAHSNRQPGPAAAFNFEDLRAQALAQVTAAQQTAQETIESARKEAELIRQKAHAEAREAGRKEGLSNAATLIEQQAKQLTEQRFAEQMKSTLPVLTKVAAALQQERDEWLVRWEQAAIELGVAIAAKLVRTNLVARPELATGMISEALKLAAGQPQLRVHLNPTDLTRFGDKAQQIVESLSACASPELIPDPSLPVGDCRLETRHGEIDARLDAMLHRIAEELLAA